MEALAVGLGFLCVALTVCWLVAISEVIRLRKLSAARERQISKFDHDRDGRIGGSVKR